MLTGMLLVAMGMVAGKTHYMLIFAHQNHDFVIAPNPKVSHSWGTWVEVDEAGNIDDVFTISWIGIKGVIYIHGPMVPENLDLEQSFAQARRKHTCVTMWGPYRVTECCFQQARRQYEKLEQAELDGSCTYNLWDRQSRYNRAKPSFNCIHALSDCCNPTIITGNRYGKEASRYIVEQFHECRLVECRKPEDDWVWEAIKPSCAHVIREKCGLE